VQSDGAHEATNANAEVTSERRPNLLVSFVTAAPPIAVIMKKPTGRRVRAAPWSRAESGSNVSDSYVVGSWNGGHRDPCMSSVRFGFKSNSPSGKTIRTPIWYVKFQLSPPWPRGNHRL